MEALHTSNKDILYEKVDGILDGKKEGNKDLLIRGNVIRTQLNNIMSYKCRTIPILFPFYTTIAFQSYIPTFSQIMFFITCSISFFFVMR